MVDKQHSSDYKLSAIRHYQISDNFNETYRVFGYNRRCLKIWYDKYTNEKQRVS
jgi:hypothetical protein